MTRNPLCFAPVLASALVLAGCGTAAVSPDAPEPTPSETTSPVPAPSPAASEPSIPAEYVAGGNEPFWSVTAGAGGLVYSSPEKLDGESLEATISRTGEWTRFASTMDGAPLILEVRKAPCQDDMSGFAFSHEARLTRADGTFRGCARLASEPQPRG